MQKLIFVGRTIHEKTRSDQYFIELLQEAFDVSIVRRDNFTKQKLIDEINAKNGDIVFFHAMPPSLTYDLPKIKAKKRVWAPMYDGFRELNFRKRLGFRFSKVKIICFSKALETYFSKIKLKTRGYQRFLKPSFALNPKKEGPYTFFIWQRHPLISIDNIVKLVGRENIQKIIYKTEIEPMPHQEYPFEIEKLDSWIDKEIYQKKLDESDYFVAPRLAEGIGWSFLEPMSQGKVILAYNNATMNEYIVDGKNGYLFDENLKLNSPLKSPYELYPTMEAMANEFYHNWEAQKTEFLQFISN